MEVVKLKYEAGFKPVQPARYPVPYYQKERLGSIGVGGGVVVGVVGGVVVVVVVVGGGAVGGGGAAAAAAAAATAAAAQQWLDMGQEPLKSNQVTW